MNPQIITVSQFLAIINETLAFAYPQVTIEGEVSSYKLNQNKFVFFDLKDERGVISCFMMARSLKLPLEDGMKVRVTGSPKVTKFSKFSLTVREIEPAGEGQLRRALQLLKAKLEAEGLFDPARKRPIPAFPARVGLITSSTSAAYSDFMKILASRWGGIDILLADVNVQGVLAPDQITEAITYFNQLPDPVDVLVLIRGGGSLEDLMAFSTEPVTRAVAASRTPIVVGVGHEIDFSLADYAADLRAATPTDAARLIAPDRREILARTTHLKTRIEAGMRAHIDRRLVRTNVALSRLELYLRHPYDRLQSMQTGLTRGFDRLRATIDRQATLTRQLESRLAQYERLVIAARRTSVTHFERLLSGFDPTTILARGYAIVRSDGRLVRSASAVKDGQAIDIQVSKGQIKARVEPTLPTETA